MAKLLVKNINKLITCDDNDRVLEHVNVLIENGVIIKISNEEMTADDVIDASNMVMYPGLINTHHHLYQTFSRNLPQVQNMELFPWLKTLYEIWKNVDEEITYYSSLTGMGELLKTGCTTCLDHHYVFPKDKSSGILDAQFAAADDLGIRFHATRGSMDLSVKDGGLPPDSVVHCPISNMKLSSGIANVTEMLKIGVPVGLAVDGSASNDGSNLLEEMRVAFLLHRLNRSHEAPSGYDILKLATRGSAKILGREEIGYLAEGMAADFFLIDLNRLSLVGAQFDVRSMLATVGFKGNVDYTVVNGKIVVKEGKLVGIDEEKITEKANKLVENYIS